MDMALDSIVPESLPWRHTDEVSRSSSSWGERENETERGLASYCEAPYVKRLRGSKRKREREEWVRGPGPILGMPVALALRPRLFAVPT